MSDLNSEDLPKDLTPTFDAIKDEIRLTLEKYDWWEYVSDDAKNAIYLMVESIEYYGIPFRNSFTSMFKYENLKRKLKQINVSNKRPSALFGNQLSEEVYQSAKTPVKFLLGMEDWSVPNDADVNACICMSNIIDMMEKNKVLTDLTKEVLNGKEKES